MAGADPNGPALNQTVLVWQGAGATYVVPIRDPAPPSLAPPPPPPDLTGATAVWWAGPVPANRQSGPPIYVANSPGAFSKALPVVADGQGGFQVILAIRPQDLSGFSPTGLYQHEIWITEVGKDPYPATIGPLVIRGTVKGAAT